MDRKVLVIKLAPAAPPCFPDRLTWIEYLKTALDDVKRFGPLDLRGPEPRFNYRFDFCGECTAKHAHAMQVQSRCRPGYLLALGREEKANA